METKHIKILIFSGIALLIMIFVFKYTLRNSKDSFNDKPVSSVFQSVEEMR